MLNYVIHGQIWPARPLNLARPPTIGLAWHPAHKISCLTRWGPLPLKKKYFKVYSLLGAMRAID